MFGRLGRNWKLSVGLGILALILLLAIFAPLVAGHDPVAMGYEAPFQPPLTGSNLLGTDNFGRDVFARVIFGFRVSLTVSVLSVFLASLVGVPMGLMAGYFGGWIDQVVMRPLDIVMAFPAIFLAIALIAVFGVGVSVAILAIALIYVPVIARTVRGSALAVRSEQFVEGAWARGASHLRIMFRHILPNCVGPLLIQISILMGIAVLMEAGLSFLGLGTQPPTPALGLMLSEGRDFMEESYWVVTFPGLGVFLLVLGCNLVADGLRQQLDVQGRRG